MRIVQVNKFLFPRDGVTTVIEETARILRRRGHEILFFGQRHERAFAPETRSAFVEPISLDRPLRSPRAKLRALGRFFFGTGAVGVFEKFIRERKPDVVHIHNIYHHLSPAIVGAAKRRGVPVVMTLHDYKLFCPSYIMWRRGGSRSGGVPCRACIEKGSFEAVRHKCVRDSTAASLVCFLEALLHRPLWFLVDRFVAPSRFMARTAEAGGVPRSKLRVIHNPAPPVSASTQPGSPPLLLYLGRLYPEKGVRNLLEACRILRCGSSVSDRREFSLVVAGEGPERERLEKFALSNRLPVAFPGFVEGRAKEELLARAAFLIFPSVWYENCPMTILEAFRAGKPVVASDIGGIPELVRDGVNGLVVPPDDPPRLARAAVRLLDDPRLRAKLGHRAERTAEEKFGEKRYAEALESVYREVT